MPKQIHNLEIHRSSNTQPFGFRLNGGKDQLITMKVEKVALFTPAADAGLKEHDFLISVQGQEIFEMSHKDVVKIIQGAGNTLSLSIERGDHIVPSFDEIWPSKRKQEEDAKKAASGMSYIRDAMEKGLPGQRGGGFTTVGKPKVAVRQYDNPFQCYSDETIEEMAETGANWEATTHKVDDVQPKEHYLSNSDVLAVIKDNEKVAPQQRGH